MVLSRLVKIPFIPGEIISRERLVELLWDNRTKALTLICASAGSGKTVLLSNYLSRVSNVCWLQCDPIIDNPVVLVLYLTESISINNKKFGKKTREYVASLEASSRSKPAIDDLITIFLNDFSENIQDDVTLVLDDYHWIQGENEGWLNKVMNTILAYIPDNMRLIISTREETGFEISRLRAKRNVFCLNTSDLAFTECETSQLLRTTYSKDIDQSATAQLTRVTSGWITGLHLLIQSPGLVLDDINKLLTGNTEDIFNYFTEDIFSKIKPEYREFLLTTSLINGFTAPDADRLLGISNSADIINDLVRKNVFISYYSTVPYITYSYHQLFAAFLKKTLNSSFNNEKLNELFLKAASVCSGKGDIYGALILYGKAGSHINAFDLLNSSFDSCFSDGNYLLIRKWFDALGCENIIQNADVLLNYLKLNIAINDLKTSDNCIRYIEDNIGINSGKTNYAKFQLCKAEYLLLNRRYDESIEIIEELKKTQIKSTLNEELHFLLAKAYYRKGFDFYEIVIETAQNLLDLSIEQNNLKYKIESLLLLGHVYSDKGDLLTAGSYYEQTLSLEENVIKLFNSFTNLVYFYSLTGNWEQAYLNLQHAKEIYENYPTTLFDRLYNRSAFQYYENIGDYHEAIMFIKKLESNESLKNDSFQKLIQYLRLAEIYYLEGNKFAAQEVFNLTKKLTGGLEEYYKTLYVFWEHFYCSQDIGSIETENALLKILDYHILHKINHAIPQFEFHLADYYLHTNRPETAIIYLEESFKTIFSKKYLSFAEKEFILSRHVFDFAVSQKIEKKFVKEIQSGLINKKELHFIREDFKKKLAEQAELLVDIKLHSFGVLEFYNRGKQINEEKWIRKKSKVLLAYLMANPQIIHTKDKIIDLFFDDMPPEKADVVYHSTIYNIRTALKIYDLKSDAPKRSKQKQYDYNPDYILYEDKTLRLNPDFFYESDNIEFEKLYDKAKLPSECREDLIKCSESAIVLYKGDFLPGNYDSWCEDMRIKYKNMYIYICESLVKLLEENKRFEEVTKYSEMLLNEDKLNESAHISLINAYSELQNKDMAKGRFIQMLKTFDKEIGEKPPEKTLNKIKSILDTKETP